MENLPTCFQPLLPRRFSPNGTADGESKKRSEILHSSESSYIQVWQIRLKFRIEHWRAVKRLEFLQNRRVVEKSDVLHIGQIASR